MVLKPSSRACRGSNTCFGFRWMCKKHRLERTLAEHTWFDRHNIPIEDVLRLTYYFSRGFKIEDAVNEISVPGRNCISHSTVMDIYSYCREVCMCRLDTLYEASGPIGDPGKLVEIDEMKFGRRKYEKCRVIEGAWIFGAIDMETKELCLEICAENKRNRDTLIPIIKKTYCRRIKNIF